MEKEVVVRVFEAEALHPQRCVAGTGTKGG